MAASSGPRLAGRRPELDRAAEGVGDEVRVYGHDREPGGASQHAGRRRLCYAPGTGLVRYERDRPDGLQGALELVSCSVPGPTDAHVPTVAGAWWEYDWPTVGPTWGRGLRLECLGREVVGDEAEVGEAAVFTVRSWAYDTAAPREEGGP